MKIHGLYEPWIFYKGQSPVPTAIFYLNLDNDVRPVCKPHVVRNSLRTTVVGFANYKVHIFPTEIYFCLFHSADTIIAFCPFCKFNKNDRK